MRFIDPVDWVIRRFNDLDYLPPYSIRARSTGLNNQLGGRRFYRLGALVTELLVERAGLKNGVKVLELGCGSGRNALAIARKVDDVSYTGMDIEFGALSWCQNNKYLSSKGYKFDFLDVENAEYNPSGTYKASEYVFPYNKEEFDIVFLISVFTHMLTTDVQNYIKQIARVLKPDGVCMLSVFLVDDRDHEKSGKLPYSELCHFFSNREMPEIMVGYKLQFLKDEFKKNGLCLEAEPLVGSWENNVNQLGQDVLLIRKCV